MSQVVWTGNSNMALTVAHLLHFPSKPLQKPNEPKIHYD